MKRGCFCPHLFLAVRLNTSVLAPAQNLMVIPGFETLSLFGLGGWGRPGDTCLLSLRKSLLNTQHIASCCPSCQFSVVKRCFNLVDPDHEKHWLHNPTWNSLRGELWMMKFEASGRPFLPFPGCRSASCLEIAGNRPSLLSYIFKGKEKRLIGRESSVLFRLILGKRCFCLFLQTGWIFPSVLLLHSAKGIRSRREHVHFCHVSSLY